MSFSGEDRPLRHRQDILGFPDNYMSCTVHAWFQLSIGVIEFHYGRKQPGHLTCRRGDAADPASELKLRLDIQCDHHLLPRLQHDNLPLTDLEVELDFRDIHQINHRHSSTGHISDLDIDLIDNAGDGRRDYCVLQAQLGKGDSCLRLGHPCPSVGQVFLPGTFANQFQGLLGSQLLSFGYFKLGCHRIPILTRHHSSFIQLGCPLIGQAGILIPCLCLLKGGFCLLNFFRTGPSLHFGQ